MVAMKKSGLSYYRAYALFGILLLSNSVNSFIGGNHHSHAVAAFSTGSWSSGSSQHASLIRAGLTVPTGFVVPLSSHMNPWRPTSGRRSRRRALASSTSNNDGLYMVINKMSQECIGAIMTSHKVSNALGMKELGREMMLVGVSGKPERADTTMAKYGYDFEMVKKSAENYIRTKNEEELTEGGNPTEDPLPFSEDAKNILETSLSIAEHFGNGSIRSEHVLLALMEYNYGNLIDVEGAKSDNPVVHILQDTEGAVRGQLDALSFCEDLIFEMKRQPDSDVDDGQGTPSSKILVEEVTIGGPSPGNTATLDKVGVDLTQMALDGKLDVVYGRDNEIRMALRTLGRRRKNNPCLIGDPGVGKTAVAEAIAQVIATSYGSAATTTTTTEKDKKKRFEFPQLKNPFNKNKKEGNDDDDESTTITEEESVVESIYPPCPAALAGYRVVSLELASLVSGTRNRGDFEEKIQKIIKEVEASNIILFIDEIHNLVGTGGGGDGAMNAANLMKPALARGKLRVLGSTTTAEYRRYIEKDAALERRFQPLTVKEPTLFETLPILGAIISNYEEYHGVTYTINALLAAAKLSDRYITDRFLPDKAIDLIDEAGSMIKMEEIFETKISSDEDKEDVSKSYEMIVTEDTIAEVVAQFTGIPVGKLDTGEKERLRNLEQEMGKRIKGQERAVKAVAKAVRRARSGLRDGKRPVASFFFCGPTGVGKTELCKSLAQTYYGQEKDMIRIDMSEYMDRFSTSRLIGAPPGYVGYDEGGQLTEAVRRAPHSVVLFDEVEKAHEDVLNVLLQIMDEGQLTDGKGRTVSFRNTIFVMTSNVGSTEILNVAKETEGDDRITQSLEMAEVVKQKLEETMKPELLNRIDEIIVFSPLSDANLRDIAVNILNETVERAATDLDLGIRISPEFIDEVTKEGMADSAIYGARPIRRAAQRFLLDPLSEAIIDDFIAEGDIVEVGIADDEEDDNSSSEDVRPLLSICKLLEDGDEDDCITMRIDDDAGIGSTESNSMDWAATIPLPTSSNTDASNTIVDTKSTTMDETSEPPNTEPDESWG